MSKLLAASLLALTASLSSCIVLVGAGAGYMIGQEVLPGEVHQAQVLLGVEPVWAQAKDTMADLADLGSGGIETTDYPRRIECEVDDAEVEVEVQAYDLNRTIIKVSAKRLLKRDGELAGQILNTILDDLGEDR